MAFDLQLMTAFLLDLCFGDPRWFPHPVKFIGMFALKVEQITRARISALLISGLFCTLIVIIATAVLTWILLILSTTLSNTFANCVAVILLYMSIAAKDLMVHSKEVYLKIELEKDIHQARIAVAKIVGRDTEFLRDGGVIKACIESVSENMVDGITAPLFWAMVVSFLSPLLGTSEIGAAAIGAMTYKSINTLDSMFGYRNEKYILYGKTAAKLDDIVNWPVARLSGMAIIIASFILGMDWKRSRKVYRRDKDKHLSPNSAHSEAAVAGALGIKLGGSSVYGGKKVYKPSIGETTRKVHSTDILQTNRIVLTGSVVFLLIMLVIRHVIISI